MGSAAIVISIITIFYFTSFDPEKDPFRDDNGASDIRSFRPNPFDVTLLNLDNTIRNVVRRITSFPLPDGKRRQRNPRLEAAYVKVGSSCSEF